jgi:hypothetical protein
VKAHDLTEHETRERRLPEHENALAAALERERRVPQPRRADDFTGDTG